jgi:adenylate kinase family enzyme
MPDDIIHELVKIYLNSAGCMNKGFILEGFPRSEMDARSIFMDKIPLKQAEPVEGAEAEAPAFEEVVN